MESGEEKKKPAAKDTAQSHMSQSISLSAPPLTELPCWGRRVEFESFFVELVPQGERVFNVRLLETFASINFAPAEGTSSLAGDRLRRYERRPYEYIIAPPRFPLQGETRNAPEVLVFVVKFDSLRAMLAQALAVAPNAISPQVVIGNPAAFTTELAKKIRIQLSATPTARLYLESLCIALLVEMFKPIADREKHKPRQRVSKRMIDMLLKYVDANLDGDLAVDRLADLAGVSADQFSRSFKKSIGESPHNYVIQRRTDAARRLLVSEDFTLAQIAYATGFSSQAHMTTAFKKVLGVTPGVVRRQA